MYPTPFCIVICKSYEIYNSGSIISLPLNMKIETYFIKINQDVCINTS